MRVLSVAVNVKYNKLALLKGKKLGFEYDYENEKVSLVAGEERIGHVIGSGVMQIQQAMADGIEDV
jgi:hypothetical protein